MASEFERNAKFEYEKVIGLDFRTASYVISVCLLKGLSLLVIGDNGVGKTQLAKAIAKAYGEFVIPIGALDMGGIRKMISLPNYMNRPFLLISDLQAFDRTRELKNKLISYLVSATDIGFVDASFDSPASERTKPLQFIIFGTAEDLQQLFRESRKHFLDRVLVIFVKRDRDLVQYNIDNDIPYELEIEKDKIKKTIPDNERISIDLFRAVVLLPREKISIRKRDQLNKLVKGLFEIGFDGSVSVYNSQEQPMDYKNYFERAWIKNHLDIEINQLDYCHWSELLKAKPEENDSRWKSWYLDLCLKRNTNLTKYGDSGTEPLGETSNV